MKQRSSLKIQYVDWNDYFKTHATDPFPVARWSWLEYFLQGAIFLWRGGVEMGSARSENLPNFYFLPSVWPQFT